MVIVATALRMVMAGARELNPRLEAVAAMTDALAVEARLPDTVISPGPERPGRPVSRAPVREARRYIGV